MPDGLVTAADLADTGTLVERRESRWHARDLHGRSPARGRARRPTAAPGQTGPGERRTDLLAPSDAPCEATFDAQREPAARARAGSRAHHGRARHPRLPRRQAQGRRALRRHRRRRVLPKQHRDRGGAGRLPAPVRRPTRTSARCTRSARAALRAMRYLREFDPRLVGPVLTGTATEHSDVQLHLFADRPEAVTLKLLDRGVPHEVTERRVKLERRARPRISRRCDSSSTSSTIEATVFPDGRHPPGAGQPGRRRPMRRAECAEVEALLAAALRARRARTASRSAARVRARPAGRAYNDACTLFSGCSRCCWPPTVIQALHSGHALRALRPLLGRDLSRDAQPFELPVGGRWRHAHARSRLCCSSSSARMRARDRCAPGGRMPAHACCCSAQSASSPASSARSRSTRKPTSGPLLGIFISRPDSAGCIFGAGAVPAAAPGAGAVRGSRCGGAAAAFGAVQIFTTAFPGRRWLGRVIEASDRRLRPPGSNWPRRRCIRVGAGAGAHAVGAPAAGLASRPRCETSSISRRPCSAYASRAAAPSMCAASPGITATRFALPWAEEERSASYFVRDAAGAVPG